MRSATLGYVARDSLMRLRQTFARSRPGVFVNSVPKSGTHLLLELLRSSGYRFGGHFTDRDGSLARSVEKKRADKHLFATGHVVSYAPRHTELILLTRRPVDVALSLANYISARKDHHLHRPFVRMDKNSRLKAVVYGMNGLEPIEERYRLFLGWALDHSPSVLEYESLIAREVCEIPVLKKLEIAPRLLSAALNSKTITSSNTRIYGVTERVLLEGYCDDTSVNEHHKKLVSLAEVPSSAEEQWQ